MFLCRVAPTDSVQVEAGTMTSVPNIETGRYHLDTNFRPSNLTMIRFFSFRDPFSSFRIVALYRMLGYILHWKYPRVSRFYQAL